MEMFLMCLCMSIFGMGVAAAAFGAATRSESSDSTAQPRLPLVKAAAAPRFFAETVAVPPATASIQLPIQVPIEVLLMQIENHIRQEQAAAESFISFPTQAHLHSKTSSPFVN